MLTLWPHPVYAFLQLAALVACVLYYAHTCGRQPDTGLVLALVPLVFAWRSLFVYFFAPLPIVCLWPLLASLRRAKARQRGRTLRPAAHSAPRSRRCPMHSPHAPRGATAADKSRGRLNSQSRPL